MNIKLDSLNKFILIGLSLFAYKAVLLVFAYVLNSQQYNAFNQAYYSASIIILFGSMGFNIAQTRMPVKPYFIFLFVAFNVIITSLLLQFLSKPFSSFSDSVPIIIYSVFIAAGTILNFRLLFEGNYKKYVLIVLLLTFAHLIVLPAAVHFNIFIFHLLAPAAVIWFFSVFKMLNRGTVSALNIVEYYKIGFSAFVINSAVSLGLAADKFIANHFFTIETANSYTFAWGITAPVFYLGNLIEKYLFAEKNPDKTRLLAKGFMISIVLISAYITAILFVINFFPQLLPGSISAELFYEIFTFMIAGYSVYALFHFPINAYLFKVLDVKKQKTISVYFSVIIAAAVIAFYFITNTDNIISYKMLLLAVWIYIFTLLTIKTIIMFKSKSAETSESNVIQGESVQEIP